jgi:hypothetical protein
VAVITAVSAALINRSRMDEFVNMGEVFTSEFASSNLELILDRDVTAIQARIDQVKETPGVDYVFVVDSKYDIIAHTFVPWIPPEIDPLTTVDDTGPRQIDINGRKVIDISAPILLGQLGYVHVGLDLGLINARNRSVIAREVVIITIVFIIVIMLLWPALRAGPRFIRPSGR